MNALATLTNQVATADKPKVAMEVMAVCRAITPQFYRNMSDIELKAERASIELLTCHIDAPVLAKMCEFAVQGYGIARSENSKAYFDINYILTHYREAFNHVWCHGVDIPSDYYWCGDTWYDERTRIITEYWRKYENDKMVGEIIVKHIQERKYDERYAKQKGMLEHHYTPKYWSERKKRDQAEQERKLADGTFWD